jgi:hypothetical protein
MRDWNNYTDYSPTQMMDAVQVTNERDFSYSNISVGQALRFMVRLTDIGPEFDGNVDGLDCLVYHLSLNCVDTAIEALQKVRERMIMVSEMTRK